MKSRYLLFLGFAFGLIAVAVIGTILTQKTYTYQGSLIEPPSPAFDFTLTDAHSRPFTLSGLQGKPVLIFFGYTYCPDVCPITLSEFKRIRTQLGPRASDVSFLFITVDPERDTPDILGAHVALFDTAIIGLTGSLTDLEPVWKAYGIVREKQESAAGSADDYLVNHTARTYVIDKRGDLRLTYPFGFPEEGILEDIQHLLDEK